MSAPKQNESQASGPRVLRVGIVRNKKMIDERELKKREPVTVGSSEKCSFTVASESIPKEFEVFEYDGTTYFLRFQPGMDARVQLTEADVQAQGLDELRRLGKIIQRKGGEAIQLNDFSRGKVMMGDVSVLFQFKAPTVIPPKPVLPPEIRGSLLQNIDGQFTAIFVVVALLQIVLVAYARTQPYIEPTSIDQIDQSFQRLIMPARNPEPPKEIADNSADKGKEEDAAKDKPKEDEGQKNKAKNDKKEAAPVDAEAAARARKEAIAKQVAGKGLLRVLGTSRGNDGALSDVFEEGGGAIGDLGEAFSGIQGVDIAGAGGQAGTRGGGSGQGVGIGELGTSGGGSVQTGGKAEAEVRGEARAEAPEVDGELSQDQISAVMKRNLKALRDCYESALKRDRKLAGKLVIRFEITDEGRTADVEVDEVSLKSGDVASCIKSRAKSWRFPKPDGGSVLVSYPIIFTPSG